METKSNYFSKDLIFEGTESNIFNTLYRAIYPNLTKIEKCSLEEDKEGKDKKLIFFDNSEIRIQEKARRVDYNDFLVELYHKKNGQTKRGWAFTMTSDFLFYKAGNYIYRIAVPTLRNWLNANIDYIKSLKLGNSWNKEGQYMTYWVAVPWTKFDFEYQKWLIK
jgi:hypothetical protein